MARTFILTLLICALGPTGAGAHDREPERDRVHLSASAGREVDTDTLVAVLYKEHQSQEQATAADEVNRAVTWGVEQAKAAGMSAQTTVYRTYPIYRNHRLAGWRVIQSFRIETEDSAALASLLGTLQSRLSIQTLQHVLSPAARAAAEERLMEEALDAFQRRAALVAGALGRPGYRIVSISLSSGGTAPMPAMAARAAVMESDTTVAPPTVDGGRQRVDVTVTGSVELNAAN